LQRDSIGSSLLATDFAHQLEELTVARIQGGNDIALRRNCMVTSLVSLKTYLLQGELAID